MGVNINGEFGFVEMKVIGCELMIVVFLVRSVYRVLCVILWLFGFNIMLLRIFFIMLIMCFYDFLKCEECGGLKIYLILELNKYCFVLLFLILILFIYVCRLFVVFMNLVF